MNNDTIFAEDAINDDYSRATYGSFSLTMRTTGEFAGYVNVSLLCKNGGKEFKHWKENELSQKQIDAFLQVHPEYTRETLLVQIQSGGKEIRGT